MVMLQFVLLAEFCVEESVVMKTHLIPPCGSVAENVKEQQFHAMVNVFAQMIGFVKQLEDVLEYHHHVEDNVQNHLNCVVVGASVKVQIGGTVMENAYPKVKCVKENATIPRQVVEQAA